MTELEISRFASVKISIHAGLHNFPSLDNNMELAGKGDGADVSEAARGPREERASKGGEGGSKDKGDGVGGDGGSDGGKLEEENIEGESPSSQAASSFPSMTSSRCQNKKQKFSPSHLQQVSQRRLGDPGS